MSFERAYILEAYNDTTGMKDVHIMAANAWCLETRISRLHSGINCQGCFYNFSRET